jgi:hypothetical protein
LTRERDEILEAHLEKRKTELASAQPFAVFIYGHTHRVENFWPVGGTQVVNEGAWQRVITPKQLEAKKGGPEEFVKTASPEDIEPGCYSLVMFEEAKPSEARLRYWVEVDGQWQTSGSCD